MSAEQQPASATEIVAAAERLADDIRRRAESDAAQIRERAAGDSDQRRQALREQVSALAALAEDTLSRARELSAQLDALRRELGDLSGPDPSHEPATAERTAADPVESAAGDTGAAGEVSGPDEVGARLVALNLAMSDTPREEIARQLREQHSMADPDKLLDDVYSSIGR